MRHAALAICALVLGACSPGDEPDRRSSSPSRVPAPTMARVATQSTPPDRSFAEFRPSLHGFRFANHFTGSPLPISLGGLEKHLNLPTHFGLCGGMSFAAADFFLAELDRPLAAKPPAKGNDLYDYLYSRQVDSLGDTLAQVPKFAQWMSLPDLSPGGVSFLSYAGLPQILVRLETGQPVHLGLVLTTTGKGQLWENHQVLAYAADMGDTLPRTIRIRIYDPNFPNNDEAVLRVSCVSTVPLVVNAGAASAALPWTGVKTVRTAPGRRDTVVRGFFVMPYATQRPPAGLSK